MNYDLFNYPRGPGFKEPTTSRDAAVAIAPRVASLRARVMRAIADAGAVGLTADECARVLGESVLAVRPRLTELGPRHGNRIEKTGARRANESGQMAAAWRVRTR